MELLLQPSPEKIFTYDDLQLLTNNFSQQQILGITQFGKMYLGRIPSGWKGMEAQVVTVKVWQDTTARLEGVTPCCVHRPDCLCSRMATEINFLSQPEMESHPNLAKVKGYCFEDNILGVVYSLKPLGTIRNLADKDRLKWLHRIKAALGLARLLEFLHGHQPRFLIRNLSSEHIMIDRDYNPILVDFAMVVGGAFGDTTEAGRGCPLGSHGYSDPFLLTTGEWTEKSDVFAFGVILLEIIIKLRADGLRRKNGVGCFNLQMKALYKKLKSEFGESKCSIVRPTLIAERSFCASDGPKISVLAIRCVDEYPDPRPTMKEIVEVLENLQFVRNNGSKLGMPEMIDAESKRIEDDNGHKNQSSVGTSVSGLQA